MDYGEKRTRICLVLEGTATAQQIWGLLRQKYIDPLLHYLEQREGGRFELSLVVAGSGLQYSRTLLERASWTSDLIQFKQSLDSLRFQGGGCASFKLADAMAEVMYLFQRPSSLGPPEVLQQHCILLCHSRPCRIPFPWQPSGRDRSQAPRTVTLEDLMMELAARQIGLSMVLQTAPRSGARNGLMMLFSVAAQARASGEPFASQPLSNAQPVPKELLESSFKVAAPGTCMLVAPTWREMSAFLDAEIKERQTDARVQADSAAAALSADSPAFMAGTPISAATPGLRRDSPSNMAAPSPQGQNGFSWNAPSPQSGMSNLLAPQFPAMPKPPPQQPQRSFHAAAAGSPGTLPGSQMTQHAPHQGQGVGVGASGQQQQRQMPSFPMPQRAPQAPANDASQQPVAASKNFRTVWQGDVVLSPAASSAQQPIQLLSGTAVVGPGFTGDPSKWPRQLVVEKFIDYRSPALTELSQKHGAAVQGRFLQRKDGIEPTTVAALQKMVDRFLGGLITLSGCCMVFVVSPGKPSDRSRFRLGFVIAPPWAV